VSALIDSLAALNVHSARSMDSVGCLDYMSYKPDGVAMFLDNVLPSNIYGGPEADFVTPFVQAGGNAVFFGALPLAYYHANGTLNVADGRMLSIYGVSPYPLSKFPSMLSADVKASAVISADSSQLANLTWWNTSGNSIVPYNALRKGLLDSLGGLVIPIQGAPGWLHSFYYGLKHADSDSNGSVMSIYPFNVPASMIPTPQLAHDLATNVWQYYFAEDLRLASVSIDSGAAHVYRGSILAVHAKVNYYGNNVFDTIRVVVSDSLNGGYVDTVSGLHVAKGVPATVMVNMPISPTAQYEKHSLKVKVLPLRYPVVDSSGTAPDTFWIDEKNVANNATSVPFLVADQVKPAVSLDSTLAGWLERPYSGKSGTLPSYFAGSVSDSSLGPVSFGLTVTTKGGNVVYSSHDSLPGAGAVNLFKKQLATSGSFGDYDTLLVALHAVDKFGNDSLLTAKIQIDRVAPKVAAWTITSPVLAVDSSSKLDAVAHKDSLMLDLAVRYYVGKGANSFQWSATDNDGVARVQVLDEAGKLVSEIPVAQKAKATGVLTSSAVLPEGLCMLRVLDAAGNADTAYAEIVRDTLAPQVGVFKTTANLADSLHAGWKLPVDYVANTPLYVHTLDTAHAHSQNDDGSEGYPVPDSRYAERLGQSSGNWETTLMATMDTLQLVVFGVDESPVAYTMSINGISVDPKTLDPYIQPTNAVALADSMRTAINHSRSGLILNVPVLKSAKEIVIVGTDMSGNTTTVTVHVKTDAKQTWEDAKGDRLAQGADFGAVYMAQSSETDGTWLHAMVHSYENYTGRGAWNYLYFDSDKNAATGREASGVAGNALVGFDYRIAWKIVDSTDVDSSVCVQEQRYTTTVGWVTDVSKGCGASATTVNGMANQANLLWTRPVGAGRQLLADGRIAEPGTVVELGFKVPFALPDTLRWVITGESDAVYDTVNVKPFGFVTGNSLPIRTDGFLSDWWSGDPPLLADLKLLEAEAHASLNSTGIHYTFDIANRGFAVSDTSLLLQLVRLDTCASGAKVSGSSDNGAFDIAPQLVKANQLPGLSGMSDDVYAIRIMVRDSVLSPGTLYRSSPVVDVWGGCATGLGTLPASQPPMPTRIIPWSRELFLVRTR